MRIFKKILSALILILILTSCTTESPETRKESTVRYLTSESGYTLRVERGSGRVEVTSPEELCGIAFSFTDTESYLETGETKIPLSPNAAMPFRDYLVMAYPEDHDSTGEASFDFGGASFSAEYHEGSPVSVTVTRGGVARTVTITEG